MKVPALIAVPAAVVTERRPVVAPVGTTVTIWVAVSETMVAGVPLKVTSVAPRRLWPAIVTVVPTGPDVGVNPSIQGVTVVVIRPTELLPGLVNHRAPSGPAAIPTGPLMPVPVWFVTVPAVVIRPIEPLPWLVNHRAPSDPAAIPNGTLMPVPVYLVTVPAVVIRPIVLFPS